MSITAQNIFEWVMAIADELTNTGTINPSDTNDYKYRTPAILNVLQANLLKKGDIFSTYEISHKPADMVVGSFNVEEFIGTDLTFEGPSSCYGYHFEIDGEATVYIEDYTSSWNTLATISVPSTVTDFTAYSGVVTPTTGASKSRVRFSGTYRYLVKNFGLFKYKYAASRLPSYRPWVLKTMPSDFKSLDQIVNEECDQYNKNTTYKWEGKNSLYVNWWYEGNIRIVYRPVPGTIDDITDIVQVDDVTARTLMVYGLGMELYKDENETLYSHFKNMYESILANTKQQPSNEEAITNHYGYFQSYSVW